SDPMTTEPHTPEVRMTIDGRVCVISLDNVAKKNAITPELMAQLSAHLTTFEGDDDLWVAVLAPAGEPPDRRPGQAEVLRPDGPGGADPEGPGRPVRPSPAYDQAGDLSRARH